MVSDFASQSMGVEASYGVSIRFEVRGGFRRDLGYDAYHQMSFNPL